MVDTEQPEVGGKSQDTGGNAFEQRFHPLPPLFNFRQGLFARGAVFAELCGHGVEGFDQSSQFVAGGSVDKVWIKGDSLATWGAGVDVMATIASSGIPFSVVAEQRPRR